MDVELKDVLYIPEMPYNLFSTNRAAENGATTTIDSQGCKVSVKGKTITVGEIDKPTGLCTLKADTKYGILMLISTRRTLEDWHKAFGHVDPRVISEMVNDRSVEGLEVIKKESIDYAQCPEGKATRASHTTVTSVIPTEVGDQVDLDLVGPLPVESLGKAKYLIVGRDSYSGYG